MWKQPKCLPIDRLKSVYTHNGILFSLKKEGNSDTCYNMDEHWRHYVNWNKPDTKGYIFYDFTYRVVKFIDRK